jgi:hypothetical protein
MADIIQPVTAFGSVAGALTALRCWLDAAPGAGHEPAKLCAVINIGVAGTTATLCTRALIASLVPQRDEGSRALAGAVLRQAPGEAFVLVSKQGGPANGDGISNIDAVLAVTAARAAAQ